MKSLHRYLRYPALIISLLFLASCSEGGHHAAKNISIAMLDIYKTGDGQCCEQWLCDMDEAGFDSKTHHPADLSRVKNDDGIAPEYRSCHMAVTSDGYVIEAHVPARFDWHFLENPPEGAIGLSVLGMSAGNPGMEVGVRFMSYQAWLLQKDGSAEVFASVNRQISNRT